MRVDGKNLLPRANVLDEPMLFVLGERFLRLFLERERVEDIRTFLLRLGLDDLRNALPQRADIRLVPTDKPRENVNRIVKEVDQLLADRNAAHAQAIQHVLERVRHLGNLAESHHSGETFERVHVAENLVDQLRASARALRFEVVDAARQSLEQLFRFAGEIIARAILVSRH